jgi:Tat protein secretion system quality control protein TatD with DNase activity
MKELKLPNAVTSSSKGCPCCSFDLFLPPGLVQESNQELDTVREESSSDNDVPLNPQQALEILLENIVGGEDTTSPIIIVDTHGHAQLERDRDETYDISNTGALVGDNETDLSLSKRIQLKAIVCAVEPMDWEATLELAAKSSLYLPALGIHPWYLGDGLPDGWLAQLESLLLEHSSAIVGEIGLCKMARWTRQYAQGKAAAFEIQRDVFQQQLQLAARLRRPVSVHCVNQHGVFVTVLKEMIAQNIDQKDPRLLLPPTIAMHSFTGTAHHAKELLTLEKQLQSDSSSDPLFYFGFSHTVNYVMNSSEKSRRKGREAVASIPSDRVLVESDVHSSQDLLGGTAGAIAYVAWARNESIHQVANVTSENGMAFLAPVRGHILTVDS